MHPRHLRCIVTADRFRHLQQRQDGLSYCHANKDNDMQQ